MDRQHKSTKSVSVEQLNLLPAKKPCPPPDLVYVASLPNFRRALRYAMSLADLEPKQVYGPLDKDKATWSRIENGDMSFPADDLLHFCEVVGNDAVLMWLNCSAGYDLASMRKSMDDKDRQIFELRQQIAEKDRVLEIATQLVSGRIPR
jgi:plasmid maintenance system antidote protein VapI